MQFTMKNNKRTIDHEDAMALEEHEKMQLRNRRIRRAIHDTYRPKQPTKFRRKLPGKRFWKDKRRQYAVLEGRMTAQEFNTGAKAKRVLEKIFKEKHAARQRHAVH